MAALRCGRASCPAGRSRCSAPRMPPRPARRSFDKFNLKYNPFGQSRLREIFIKQVGMHSRPGWLRALAAAAPLALHDRSSAV